MASCQSHCPTRPGGKLSILGFLLPLPDCPPSETRVSEQDCIPGSLPPPRHPSKFRVISLFVVEDSSNPWPLRVGLWSSSRVPTTELCTRVLRRHSAPGNGPFLASCLRASLLPPHSPQWMTPGLSLRASSLPPVTSLGTLLCFMP